MSDPLLDATDSLRRLRFDLADAVHLAAAESLKVDVFLSVDDWLLRRANETKTAFPFGCSTR